MTTINDQLQWAADHNIKVNVVSLGYNAAVTGDVLGVEDDHVQIDTGSSTATDGVSIIAIAHITKIVFLRDRTEQ